MSNTLRIYEDSKASEYEGFGHKSETMMVTAFMGAYKYGSGIQITMDHDFFSAY